MLRKIAKWVLAILFVAILGLFLWGYEPDIALSKLKAKYANSESEFVELGNGLTVHLRDEGPKDAPAIILLHGSNSSLHTWDKWTQNLKSNYRIIRYDQTGHGLTGPDMQDCYTQKCFADIVDKIAANRRLDRFILGGNSMGGGIAYSYARLHPEKLNGLILVDAAGAPQSRPKQLPIGFRIMRWPIINQLATIITPRSVIERSLYQSVSKAEYIDDKEIDLYWELLRRAGNRAATIKRFSQYAQQINANQDATPLNIPTLILWGDEDKLIPVSSVKWFEKLLPRHETHVYPKTGHLPMQEVATQSAKDVKNWLDTGISG